MSYSRLFIVLEHKLAAVLCDVYQIATVSIEFPIAAQIVGCRLAEGRM